MAVNVIDTLKPKNNGDFPVVEAEDVAVGTVRLPEALNQKADKSALDATNAALAGKASTAEVTAATNNLQGQIDQIVISASAEAVVAPEVAAARVDSYGVTHSTLKERCDNTESKLNETNEAVNNSNAASISCLESIISLADASSLQLQMPIYLNHGSIRSTTIDNPQVLPKAIYTTPTATDTCETVFTAKTGYKFVIVLHNNDGTFNSLITPEWQTGTYTLTKEAISAYDGLLSAEIQRADNENITGLPYDAITITKRSANAIKSQLEKLNDSISEITEELGLHPIQQSLFTVDNSYINSTGYVSNQNFRSTALIPLNNAKQIEFVKTTSQSDGYTVAFYSGNSLGTFISGVLLNDISSPETISVPDGANYYICSERKTGDFEATVIATAEFNSIAEEVINARTSVNGISYSDLKSRIDAVERSSGADKPVGNNIVTTFDKSVLSINGEGKICYDGTTLTTAHQNYAFLRNSSNVNSFSFSFTGYSARCGIELFNGDKVYIVVSKTAQAPYYFRTDFYDKNTSIISPSTYIDREMECGEETADHEITVVKNGNHILVYIDGNLLIYIKNKLFDQNIRRIGYAFKSGEVAAYTELIINKWDQYAHISFDDQIDVLKALTGSGITSIYDVSQFSTLRELHQTYGCTFTLMLFYEDAQGWDISQLPTTFKNEFLAASDWLKLGYHSHYTTSRAEELTTAELIEDMSLMYSTITNFADESSIDYCPRLGYFSCTKEQALAIAEAGLVTGLLTADDTRNVNVGLTAEERAIMEKIDRMADYANGILYARSRIRLDSLTEEQVINTLNSQYNRNNATSYELFAHSIDQSTLETVAEWLSKKSIKYGFAMDNLDF